MLAVTERRDGWNPVQYRQFAAQRAEPFWDLVELLQSPPGSLERQGFERAVDLGCGSGELTIALADRLGVHDMVGVDTSDAMLATARQHGEERDADVRFALGDIATWTGRADHDLVFANASLHWVADHPAVLARWWEALRDGGQLAVQVPANSDHVAHTVATRVAATEPFLSEFDSIPPPDPVATNVLPIDHYAVVLDELGAADLHVRMQVYAHRLESTESLVEWVRGTTLTRFFKRLPAELIDRFVATYRDALLTEVGDASPYLYPFKRILLWARK